MSQYKRLGIFIEMFIPTSSNFVQLRCGLTVINDIFDQLEQPDFRDEESPYLKETLVRRMLNFLYQNVVKFRKIFSHGFRIYGCSLVVLKKTQSRYFGPYKICPLAEPLKPQRGISLDNLGISSCFSNNSHQPFVGIEKYVQNNSKM